MRRTSGPDEKELPFDDLVDAELDDEITTPGTRRVGGPVLTMGDDVYDGPPESSFVVERVPLDELDAALVAYLLDLYDVHVDEPSRPDDARPQALRLRCDRG